MSFIWLGDFEVLYDIFDHILSVERAPRVGPEKKDTFACGGIRPLKVAAKRDQRRIQQMRSSTPKVTGDGHRNRKTSNFSPFTLCDSIAEIPSLRVRKLQAEPV